MNYRSKILNRIQIELKKDERKPVIYSSLITIFLLILVIAFLIPSLDIISNLSARNTELKNKEQELNQIYNSYKTASDYYNVIKDRTLIFEANIPEDTDPYYFIKQVNNIAIKNNVVLKTLRLISKQDGTEGYDVAISGNYTNINSFFNELNRDPRYFSTDYLNLKPLGDAKTGDRLSLSARIYIFYKL